MSSYSTARLIFRNNANMLYAEISGILEKTIIGYLLDFPTGIVGGLFI